MFRSIISNSLPLFVVGLTSLFGLLHTSEAAMILDFGGTDYVDSNTALTSGVKFNSPGSGADGTFTARFNGTLTLINNNTDGDHFFMSSADSGANNWMVTWDVVDLDSGFAGASANQTGLAPSDLVARMHSDITGQLSVPRSRYVVQVGGLFYA